MPEGDKFSADEAILTRLLRAKEVNSLLLQTKPNVIGLGIGFRVRGGHRVNEPVVKVYVSRKLPPELLGAEEIIPATIRVGNEEVSVDVEQRRKARPLLFTRRTRPLVGGSSIGAATRGGVGTLGICVTLNDHQTYILSCNHVFAENGDIPIGTDIVQPGVSDGGVVPGDVVAQLTSFVDIDFGTTTVSFAGLRFKVPNPNQVDAAIAQVTNGFNGADRRIHWIGYPRHADDTNWSTVQKLLLIGRRVTKMGRTTHSTIGEITSVFLDLAVGPYWNGLDAWFTDQMEIEGENGPFALPGDSGSLLVDLESRNPLGLIFARGGDFGFANPLDDVMSQLEIPRV